jgi:hypothetical protein
LYSSPKMFKSKKMRWVGHTDCTGIYEMHTTLQSENLKGKRPLLSPSSSWEDKLKESKRNAMCIEWKYGVEQYLPNALVWITKYTCLY